MRPSGWWRAPSRVVAVVAGAAVIGALSFSPPAVARGGLGCGLSPDAVVPSRAGGPGALVYRGLAFPTPLDEPCEGGALAGARAR